MKKTIMIGMFAAHSIIIPSSNQKQLITSQDIESAKIAVAAVVALIEIKKQQQEMIHKKNHVKQLKK